MTFYFVLRGGMRGCWGCLRWVGTDIKAVGKEGGKEGEGVKWTCTAWAIMCLSSIHNFLLLFIVR